jgi:(2Fe-2S) ferredoxin
MPHRERYLFVCTNRRPAGDPKGSCADRGSEEILQSLKKGLVNRGAAKSMRACGSTCLDLCEIGATIVQEPDHVAYGNVTLADVDELVEAFVAGRVLRRLVVHGE